VGLRGLNIAARKAYHALKRFRKFNCIMLTISPYMNDRPHGPFGQLSCLVLKRMCEDHNASSGMGAGISALLNLPPYVSRFGARWR